MGKPLTGPQCFSAQLVLRPVIVFSIPVLSIVSGRDSLMGTLRICSFRIILDSSVTSPCSSGPGKVHNWLQKSFCSVGSTACLHKIHFTDTFRVLTHVIDDEKIQRSPQIGI